MRRPGHCAPVVTPWALRFFMTFFSPLAASKTGQICSSLSKFRFCFYQIFKLQGKSNRLQHNLIFDALYFSAENKWALCTYKTQLAVISGCALCSWLSIAGRSWLTCSGSSAWRCTSFLSPSGGCRSRRCVDTPGRATRDHFSTVVPGT